jgi:murein DD-endopeptidase MepM/ murein hydrolase activator NlpD
MEIRISVPRPMITLSIVAIFFAWYFGILSLHLPWSSSSADAVGGERASLVITEKMQDINRERVKKAVLERREETLRYQFSLLEEEALRANGDPEAMKQVNDARAILLSIIKEQKASEKLLMLSLTELWEAEGSAFTLTGIDTDTRLFWPVSPRLGISAHFEDKGYEQRFGFPHHAIDIPAAQGTAIQAPADGVVLKIADNGLGYSYVVLQHAGGVQTIYGHISGVMVQEGQELKAGDEFARTGGRPGTQGAGLHTTGPHLHFAVRVNGVLTDPIKLLPKL